MQAEDLQATLKELADAVITESLCTVDEQTQILTIGSESDQINIASQDLSEDELSQKASEELRALKVEDKDSDVRQRISKMSIPQKLKLALFGNSVCRVLLMRDANRIVQLTVLKNPQLSLREIEDFAKSSNSPDYVLRTISDNQTWVRSYTVKVALVCNPKTPQDLSMKWLRFINQNDLKRISKSKSVPQLIAVTAKKRLSEMQT